MIKLRATQQTIVFSIFVVMFIALAAFLPGFAQVDNLLTLFVAGGTMESSHLTCGSWEWCSATA